MTSPNYDTLERELQSLTAGPEVPPGLWRRATNLEKLAPTGNSLTAWGGTEWRRRVVLPVAAVLVLFLVVAAILPSLGQARRVARQVPASKTTFDAVEVRSAAMSQVEASKSAAVADELGRTFYGYAGEGAPAASPVVASNPSLQGILRPAQEPSAPGPPGGAASRHVVRKSTLELESPDIPAAFAKVAHTLSEARGEYMENSSLTGEGPNARATLTLRVAADRLSAVLNDLRPLGKVIAESTTGEDVTAQAVDLDARARNEQRIEAELLQLLEKRADAPLKDVLELRQSLSSVRESIERLQGQRQHLSRLVSLATVLVIIRAPEKKPEPAPARSGLWDYFKTNVGAAWTTGLAFLADTVAALVKVAVGGLLWWLLAVIVVVGAVRYHRRALARGV